jgi:hypothetical protein
MTGWRVGYICANAELMQAFSKVHQYAVMSAPTFRNTPRSPRSKSASLTFGNADGIRPPPKIHRAFFE